MFHREFKHELDLHPLCFAWICTWVRFATLFTLGTIPGHALHEKGLQGQLGVGTLFSSQARRAAVVLVWDRSSAARRVPWFGLHWVYCVRASEESNRTFLFFDLEVERKSSPGRTTPRRRAPLRTLPAPPALPCLAPPSSAPTRLAPPGPAPPCLASPRPAHGISWFWVRPINVYLEPLTCSGMLIIGNYYNDAHLNISIP